MRMGMKRGIKWNGRHQKAAVAFITTHRPSKAVRRRPTESCRRSRLQSPCSRTDSARKLARLLEPPALYYRVMLETEKESMETRM